jgi:hypothetical protein
LNSPLPFSATLEYRMEIWFYGFVKTTLEIPDDLFRKAKAAAALRGVKLRDFVAEALASQLAKGEKASPTSTQRRLPPPPRVSKAELRRVHQLIEEDSERIDPEDWK